MSNAYAEFVLDRSRVLLRKSTRLYNAFGSYTKASGNCLGTVWLCNPGSATGGSTWGPCTLDKTLSAVLGVFHAANTIARANGQNGAATDDYLEILNLHYACDADVMQGWAKSWNLLPKYSEAPTPGLFRWIAWGDVPQALLVDVAGLLAHHRDYFFYDVTTKSVQVDLNHLNHPIHPYGAVRHKRSHPNCFHLLANLMAAKLP